MNAVAHVNERSAKKCLMSLIRDLSLYSPPPGDGFNIDLNLQPLLEAADKSQKRNMTIMIVAIVVPSVVILFGVLGCVYSGCCSKKSSDKASASALPPMGEVAVQQPAGGAPAKNASMGWRALSAVRMRTT